MESSLSNVFHSDMEALSSAEWLVAVEYSKGMADKEVADNLQKSVWTTKTQKRTIYRKLGISKDTELVLYVLCVTLKRDFDLKEIRKHGLEILFSILFIAMQVTCTSIEINSTRCTSRTRASVSARARLGRRNNELDLFITT